MNPDKLFDYLDGKLSASERAQMEERFVSDPEARRELTVARQIHASMTDSREVVGIEEITFSAPIAEQNEFANTVLDEAKRAGGSAVKGLADEHGILLFAEIPTARVKEFREALKKLGANIPATTTETNPGDKTILQ